MGLDGGTIPTRGELVRVKQKPEQKDKSSDTIHKWNNCTITQLPLETHLVLCHLGMLFNKKSILELLLGKNNLRECNSFQHIESLKDVRELRLTPNRMHADSVSPYVCPVTGLEMNGKHRFICLWECGCVLSERALKEVPSTMCHNCEKKYSDEDIVIINPNDADFEIMRTRMAQRKALSRRSIQPADKVGSMTSQNRLPELNDASLTNTKNFSSTNLHFAESTSSTSTCIVIHKRKHREVAGECAEKDSKTSKSSKHGKAKKDHKHKKHKKGKKSSRHEKTQSGDTTKPKLHPGWSDILAKGSRSLW